MNAHGCQQARERWMPYGADRAGMHRPTGGRSAKSSHHQAFQWNGGVIQWITVLIR